MLVVVLTLWALLVVMPDALRIVRPLGSLGLSADNNGTIYSVDPGGPAAKAGVRVGDRVALDAMSCRHLGEACAQLLSIFAGMGGLQYVRANAAVSLLLRTPDQRPGELPRKAVTIRSQPEQHGTTPIAHALWQIALGLDELGALAFILCSAWLVWYRPCTTTAGFFAYALWFNPGQYFEFYSWLQGHPLAMLAQETLQAAFQSLGYVGFLVLALFFPNNVARPKLQWVVRALPALFVVLSILQLSSFLNAFGLHTELVTRASFIAGWLVDLAVLVYVLPVVLLDQRPEERARTKWLLTGCVVGLSAFILADFTEATTMSPFNLSETTTDFLYFANVTTLAVVIYTLLHNRVVNVRFALTRGLERVGMWAIVTALGAFLIHRIDEGLGHELHWDELAVSLALVGVTLTWERVQETAIDLLDYVFFPRFRRALEDLRSLAHDLCDVKSIPHVERTLIDQPIREFKLSSAAVFRLQRSGLYRRASSYGWPPRTLRDVHPVDPLVADLMKEGERSVRLRNSRWATGPLPEGVAQPTVAVPVRAFGRLHAIVLYGAHTRGDDVNNEELEVLEGLAHSAALAYESIEAAALRRQLGAVARMRTAAAGASTAGG